MERHVHFTEIIIQDGIFICKTGFVYEPPWLEKIYLLFMKLQAILEVDMEVQEKYINHWYNMMNQAIIDDSKYGEIVQNFQNAVKNNELLKEILDLYTDLYNCSDIPMKYIIRQIRKNKSYYWNNWGTLLEKHDELTSLINKNKQNQFSKRKLNKIHKLINSLPLQPLQI